MLSYHIYVLQVYPPPPDFLQFIYIFSCAFHLPRPLLAAKDKSLSLFHDCALSFPFLPFSSIAWRKRAPWRSRRPHNFRTDFPCRSAMAAYFAARRGVRMAGTGVRGSEIFYALCNLRYSPGEIPFFFRKMRQRYALSPKPSSSAICESVMVPPDRSASALSRRLSRRKAAGATPA